MLGADEKRLASGDVHNVAQKPHRIGRVTVQHLAKHRLPLAVADSVYIDAACSLTKALLDGVTKYPYGVALKRDTRIKHVPAAGEECLLGYYIDVGIFIKIRHHRFSRRDIRNAGTMGSVGRSIMPDLVHQQGKPVFGYHIFPGLVKGGIRVYRLRFEELTYVFSQHLGIENETTLERLLLQFESICDQRRSRQSGTEEFDKSRMHTKKDRGK